MDVKTCCIAGRRDIETDKLKYVKEEVIKEIQQAIEDGYTHFISGFAKGVDLLFASIVVDLMKTNPELTLEASIPYRNRMQTTNKLFQRLIRKCKIVGIHSEEYSPFCYMRRNRIMVGQSQRIIAVYDRRKKDGTLFTMQCAYSQNREVHVIKI